MRHLSSILAAWLLLVASAFAGTPTQYYVDSVSGNDGNAGTSFGAAWKTLKYAVETGITRDSTNGDQINLYAPSGTPDDYSSGDPAIVIGDYASTATSTAPLIIRGIASDGTTPAIAYVTFAGRALFSNTSFDDLTLINLSAVGGNSTASMTLRHRFNVIGCLVDSTGGGDGIEGNQSCSVIHSDIQGSSGSNYLVYFGTSSGNMVIGNYIHERANACFGVLGGGRIVGNIIHTASTNSVAYSINSSTDYLYAANNYILSDTASTARGISNSGVNGFIINNYIEGYSGSGGVGIYNSGGDGLLIAGNRFFNCATNITPGDCRYVTDNSSTTASGIASLSTGDYTPTAELKEIALPLAIGGATTYINVGAIQNEAEAGGGGGGTDQVTIAPFNSGDLQEDNGVKTFAFTTSFNGEPTSLSGGAIQFYVDGGSPLTAGMTLDSLAAGVYTVTIDTTNANFNGGGEFLVTLSTGTVGGVPVANTKVGEGSVGRFSSAPANFNDLDIDGDGALVNVINVTNPVDSNLLTIKSETIGDDAAANFVTFFHSGGDSTSLTLTSLTNLIADIGSNGSGLTALPWNASWDAEVQSESADALVAYDPPTNAELDARTRLAAEYATAANLQIVDDRVDDILIDTAEIGVAGAGLTAITFDDSDVLEAIDAVDEGLILANSTLADLDAAVSNVAGEVNNMYSAYEPDGGGYRLTTNALEQAPTGSGGAADWTSEEKQQMRYRLGLDGATDVPGATANLATQASVNDIPTNAELDARTLPAANYFDPTVDAVTVGTNNDKGGYSLSVTPPTTAQITAAIEALASYIAMAADAETAATQATAAGVAAVAVQNKLPSNSRRMAGEGLIAKDLDDVDGDGGGPGAPLLYLSEPDFVWRLPKRSTRRLYAADPLRIAPGETVRAGFAVQQTIVCPTGSVPSDPQEPTGLTDELSGALAGISPDYVTLIVSAGDGATIGTEQWVQVMVSNTSAGGPFILSAKVIVSSAYPTDED